VESFAPQSDVTVPPVVESSDNQVIPSRSYASLIDPDEGTSLNFVSTEVLNGQKVVKIDKDDVEHEIMYWSNAVICSVLGANPPFEVIKGFVNRIWAAFEVDKIIQVRRGYFWFDL